MAEDLTGDIEHELFALFRRTFPIHLLTQASTYHLDRSTYSILCLLDDHGPQRLGQIADHFRLDASTITRQVQAAERLGLATKDTDPGDRRAMIVRLTPEGYEALAEARGHRQARLGQILHDWSGKERAEFLRALRRFNQTLARWRDDGRARVD